MKNKKDFMSIEFEIIVITNYKFNIEYIKDLLELKYCL